MSDTARTFGSGAVATPHYLASMAGATMLASGGNAVDAAVAASLVLGVVTPYLCGYGGDLLALVWDGDLHAYRGVGRSPQDATIDGVRERSGGDDMPTFGAHTVTVPGAIDGWFTLLERFGSRSFGEVAATALRYATDGFPVSTRGAWYFARSCQLYSHFGLDDFAHAYGGARPGEWLAQPALAKTISTLAADGPDVYYRGPIGEAIAQRLAEAGSFMTPDDLARHEGAWVTPLRASFHGTEIVELPPPTQGVTALELLRIVDGLDLPPAGPAREHLLIEAAKLAILDRDTYVGDPDSMTVDPALMITDRWVAQRRETIDPDRASNPAPHPGPDGGTIYMCAADADGRLVSLIQSNFTAAGSGVSVPAWGINLQNRGSSFRLQPGHPNALGPSKLPMHTLIPAMAMRDGRPSMVFGTMGGHGQAQTHLQMLVRMLIDGEDPQSAISAPRFAVDPGSWVVGLESRYDTTWTDDLRRRGHEVRIGRDYDDGMGHAHAIQLLSPGYCAASDPRAEGAALGL
ncbi:MAG: ggt [Actinomycetia bacterium]|nr:ggt [Actinomycetes bacterium]